jgi:MerR family transcriptional regulator, thiopeptide resistance regulator
MMSDQRIACTSHDVRLHHDRMDNRKIGTVANISGLSVRTLHHWDAIGLLSPSGRTASGHRVYSDADVGRLYQIMALRKLGLSLDSIATALDGDVDMGHVVSEHIASVDAALTALTELQLQLRRIEGELADGGAADVSTVLAAIAAIDVARPERERVLSEHLTDEQLQHLATAGQGAGPAAPYLLQVEWPSLYARADALRNAGVPPTDPAMGEIAKRMNELSIVFGGSRSGSPNGVTSAWRDDPVAMSGDPDALEKGWDDLADYVEQARLCFTTPAREMRT